MKKLICIVISILMVFTLASCDVEYIIDSFILEEGLLDLGDLLPSVDMEGGNDQVGSAPNIETTDRIELDTETVRDAETDKNKEHDSSQTPILPLPDEEEDTDGENGDNPTLDNDKEEDTEEEKVDEPTHDNANNSSLPKTSTGTMKIPENFKHLVSSNTADANNTKSINVKAVTYYLDGNIIDWKTENDLIYVLTSDNNRLVIIDSKTMCPLYNIALSGVPAELNIYEDKIYISLPELCKIDIFSKDDCKKESSLYFDHEVSSFCLDGDYIYYSEHDQHCKVFKKDLITNDCIQITNNGKYISFYFPKLYLNKEDGILYIGETNSSGSAIYYYDADTLEQLSVFKKDNYGLTNHIRDIFHVGDDIFWGDYRLSDTNAKELIGKYGSKSYGSTVFASENLVSTYDGLFLTDTYECIINYSNAGFDYDYLLVTESNNFFFRQRGYSVNTIIGVNFNLQ